MDRGLDCDPSHLLAILERMSYYRLNSYCLAFRASGSNDFLPGTTLANVMRAHDFDSRLRRLYFGALEMVEVRLRAAMTNVLGERLGPMEYANRAHMASEVALARDLAKLAERLAPPTEDFIETFRAHHDDPYPPIWMATEIMTFGLLSKWYDNLGSDSIRKEISKQFGFFAPAVFSSYLRHATVVRNVCAHHSRLWNRRFSVKAALVTSKPDDLAWAVEGTDSTLLYRGLAMTVYVVRRIAPGASLVGALRQHLLTHRDLSDDLDAPKGFEEDAIWGD